MVRKKKKLTKAEAKNFRKALKEKLNDKVHNPRSCGEAKTSDCSD